MWIGTTTMENSAKGIHNVFKDLRFVILDLWSVILDLVAVAQLCPTLCNSMDCSLSGSSVHGIFQARVLEWIAISFCRGSFWPRDQTWISHTTADPLPSQSSLFPFSRVSSQPRNQTGVSCIAGGFFTNWAIREASPLLVIYTKVPCVYNRPMKKCS